MLPDEVEDFRRETEAREWLRRGYTTRAKVDKLIASIEAKRGRGAAEELREEMRKQWLRRVEWQG